MPDRQIAKSARPGPGVDVDGYRADVGNAEALDLIEVVIVDDHHLLADGLRRSLDVEPNISVVGVADDTEPARRLVATLRPDVVLLDQSLPSGEGVDLAEDLKAVLPMVRIILLTAHTDPALVARAVRVGCDGFIRKTASTQELVQAVISVKQGDAVFSPSDLRAALDHLHDGDPTNERGLSPRELDVLRLLASGTSTAAMSAQLYVSDNTTRSHVRNILKKFGAHSKLEAVAIAMREGIVDSGPTPP